MRKVIDGFALEQKTATGKPSGVFKMDKHQSMALGKEVIGKVKNLQGADLDGYIS